MAALCVVRIGVHVLSLKTEIGSNFSTIKLAGGGTCLLIPALGRQRQEDLCECMASLVYIESLKPAKTAKTLSQKN